MTGDQLKKLIVDQNDAEDETRIFVWKIVEQTSARMTENDHLSRIMTKVDLDEKKKLGWKKEVSYLKIVKILRSWQQ